MRKLGTADLEILHLAVRKGGTFDENDLEKSELGGLGVGRILDALASLRDRKMIALGSDGSFSITDLARDILWSAKTPTWAKILRLLQIRSCSAKQMAGILGMRGTDLLESLEKLRRGQLVMMSPQRQDGRVVKTYEILPEGITQVGRTESEWFESAEFGGSGQKAEILGIIDGIGKDVLESQMARSEKDAVSEKLGRLKDRLRI